MKKKKKKKKKKDVKRSTYVSKNQYTISVLASPCLFYIGFIGISPVNTRF